MKKVLIFILILCLMLTITMGIAGCSSKKINDPIAISADEEILLFDYFCSANADVDGGGHYEITLTTSEHSDYLYLDEYVKTSDEDEEINTKYSVPYAVYEECLSIADMYNMQEWNDEPEPISLDGNTIVCKYFDGIEYIRVSNDAMQKNGEKAFDEIRNTLSAYIKPQYLIK